MSSQYPLYCIWMSSKHPLDCIWMSVSTRKACQLAHHTLQVIFSSSSSGQQYVASLHFCSTGNFSSNFLLAISSAEQLAGWVGQHLRMRRQHMQLNICSIRTPSLRWNTQIQTHIEIQILIQILIEIQIKFRIPKLEQLLLYSEIVHKATSNYWIWSNYGVQICLTRSNLKQQLNSEIFAKEAVQMQLLGGGTRPNLSFAVQTETLVLCENSKICCQII